MNNIQVKKRREFYTTKDFPKLLTLEENFKGILTEFNKNLNEQGENLFDMWVEKELYEESNPTGWQVSPIIVNGQKINNKHEKFPFLCEVLDKIPGIVSALFSLLKPKTTICEHEGYQNYADKILRYHLGVIVPKGDIALRCNNIIKYWQNGKSFIFDDSLPHGAWNNSNFNRYVLIVDFIKNDIETVKDLNDVILTSEAQYFYEKYNKNNLITEKNIQIYLFYYI